MIRFLFVILTVVVLTGQAYAQEEIKLYKDNIFGQDREIIQKINGIGPCGASLPDGLCLKNQTFAGSKWTQAFIFSNDKLVSIVLHAKSEESRYRKALGAIINNNFLPLVLQMDGASFDLIANIRTQGQKAASEEFAEFENMALQSGAITYILVEKNVLAASKKANSYRGLVEIAPYTMRAVELELSNEASGDWTYLRFLAPKAVFSMAQEEIRMQKEDF